MAGSHNSMAAISAAELAISKREGLLARRTVLGNLPESRLVNTAEIATQRKRDHEVLAAAAAEKRIPFSALRRALRLFETGDQELISRVKAGEIGVYEALYGKRSATQPSKKLPNGEARDKYAGRTERAQLNAQLWKQLRAVLDGLTGFPLAAEVAHMPMGKPQLLYIGQRIAKARKWIGDFEDAFRNR